MKTKLSGRVLTKYAELKLKQMSEYFAEMEAKFTNDIQLLSERFDIKEEGVSEEDLCAIADFYADEHYKISNIFMQTFRYSTLVTLHSFLETSITSLCKLLEKEHSYAITLKDLAGDGVIRCKTYLEKVCLLSFPSNLNEWQEIIKFINIRNLIVHCAGKVKMASSPQKLQNIIKSSPGLGLNSHEEITIEREYVLKAICNIRNVLTILYAEAFSSKSSSSPGTARGARAKATRKR